MQPRRAVRCLQQSAAPDSVVPARGVGKGGLEMKILLWIGVLLLALGIASLFVPIPHTDTQTFKAGDVSFGVQTHHSDRVSPIISAVLILGGVGLMMVGSRQKK